MKSKDSFPVVLITGAAQRIGAEIARAFAKNSWRVLIHYRNSAEEADQLFTEIGGESAGHGKIQQDLLQPDAPSRLIQTALNQFGHLDCLVNNASTYRRSPMADLTEKWVRDAFAINFEIPFQLMREFYRQVRQGSVINLLDQRVATVDPSAGAYGLAKKALRDATEACALEWAPKIRVNGIAPGIVLPPPHLPANTSMDRILQFVPMKQQTAPAEIGNACVFLAQSPTITGQILYLDGGLHLPNGNLGEKSGLN